MQLAPIPPDLAAFGNSPERIIAAIAARGQALRTACGAGQLAWHSWGQGRPLVLLHGGYGSWMHWLRNVLPLADAGRRVLAVDLPGLGASADAPLPHTAESLAAIVIDGIEALIGPDAPLDLVGFSFGGVLGGHVAAGLGRRLGWFVVVGSGGMGLPRAPIAPLLSWRRAGDAEARRGIHRENLAILMLADAGAIDPVAVHVQQLNAEQGRVRSPEISRTDTLRRALPRVQGRLAGIWGEQDCLARGMLESRAAVLREADPSAPFHVIPRAGHWVAYEAADAFNATLLGLLAGDAATSPLQSPAAIGVLS